MKTKGKNIKTFIIAQLPPIFSLKSITFALQRQRKHLLKKLTAKDVLVSGNQILLLTSGFPARQGHSGGRHPAFLT